jgi:hypothetical protein
MKISELNDLIILLCPIDGINSNGVIWFKGEATEQQRLDAQALMDNNINNLEV